MRDDFAVFILSNGRANNIKTLSSLNKSGYTGEIYFIIDDDDSQLNEYCSIFGKDHVQTINKQSIYQRTDTIDNFNKLNAVVYARNDVFHIAKRLGLTYFLMLDDDYTEFMIRYPNLNEAKLCYKYIYDFDWICNEYIDFLEKSGALTVAFAQGGDFLGGVESGTYWKGILRKAMNCFFCKTDRPFEFFGSINEDVNAYVHYGSIGKLMFTTTLVSCNQAQTQLQDGGLTDIYLDMGTYVKSFYSVIMCPSAVKVSLMGSNYLRIHHNVDWDACVPKIISGRYKK